MKFIEEKIKEINPLDKKAYYRYWLDNDTFVIYFNFLHDDLPDIFSTLIDKEDESYALYAEYQEDTHKIIYKLEFDDDSINVSDSIQSLYIDHFVLDIAINY